MKIEQEMVPEAGTAKSGAGPFTHGVDPMAFSDRALPRWASLVSIVFSCLIALCFLAFAALAALFETQVIAEGDVRAAAILMAVAVLLSCAGLVLEYAHVKALAGFRALRESRATATSFALVCGAALILMVVHFSLGAGLIFMIVASWAAGQLLRKFQSSEAAWDYHETEAISILSGRDRQGLEMARDLATEASIQPALRRAIFWVGLGVSLAVSAALVSVEILNLAAVFVVLFVSLWAGDVVTRYFLGPIERGAAEIFARQIDVEYPDQEETFQGLQVHKLSVAVPNGKKLLSDISFSVEPGMLVGIDGPSASGKSLLCQAIIAAQDLRGLHVSGSARVNGVDLWQRSEKERELPAAYLPEAPLLLRASGQRNLYGFRRDNMSDGARRILEKLLADQETVAEICDAPDATCLAFGHKKALALSRAFALHPWVYLIDRPEDTATDALISAMVSQIRAEQRLGRSFLVVTQNRALLDACDKLLILQDGRLIDFGDAGEIRAKQTTGWVRFSSACDLDQEDNLVFWASSQFKRKGDESNQRRISIVVSEMLAFACQNSAGADQSSSVLFELKHFKKYCAIRMVDDGPKLTNASLQNARAEATENPGNNRLSPLATILQTVREFTCTEVDGRRATEVKVDTYDPRLVGPNGGERDAASQS